MKSGNWKQIVSISAAAIVFNGLVAFGVGFMDAHLSKSWAEPTPDHVMYWFAVIYAAWVIPFSTAIAANRAKGIKAAAGRWTHDVDSGKIELWKLDLTNLLVTACTIGVTYISVFHMAAPGYEPALWTFAIAMCPYLVVAGLLARSSSQSGSAAPATSGVKPQTSKSVAHGGKKKKA